MRAQKLFFLKSVVGVIFTLLLNNSNAQVSANATLNVYLADVRSIKINPSQTVVNLSFLNANDYSNGVANLQSSHLEVTSTGGYIIKVKASSNNLVNGSNNIPVSSINLKPTLATSSTGVATNSVAGGGAALASIYLYEVGLSAAPKLIVESGKSAAKALYNIIYKANGGPDYINAVPGNYTTTITYSIEPD